MEDHSYRKALVSVCTNFILFPVLYVLSIADDETPRQYATMALIWGFVMRLLEPHMDDVIGSPKLIVFVTTALSWATMQWVQPVVTLVIGCLMCMTCGYGLAQTLHRAVRESSQ